MVTTERTKRCTRCQTVKPWSDYYPRTRWEDGTTRTVRSHCQRCEVESVRGWARRNPDHSRRLWREAEARRRADPIRRAIRRDQVREANRRRLGVTPDRYRPLRVVRLQGSQRATVPAPPFAAWLATLGSTPAVIARATELNERRIHAVIKGEQERVEQDTVDRALLAVGDGTTLEDLYETEELAA